MNDRDHSAKTSRIGMPGQALEVFPCIFFTVPRAYASAPADLGQLHTKPQAQGASFWSQLKGPAALGPFHTVLPHCFGPPVFFFGIVVPVGPKWQCGIEFLQP